MPPVPVQLLIQVAGLLSATGLAAVFPLNKPDGLVIAAGLCAAGLAWLTRQPIWWRFIHAGFLPLALVVGRLGIAPGWFLAAFIGLLLVYRGAITGRVPLYLSNARTAVRLAGLAEERRVGHLIDLGAGIGSITFRVARIRPDMAVTGVESAPLTWLVGAVIRRVRGPAAVDWQYGNMWQVDLSGFDMVYAFLSPEPMPALWAKACAEMKAGSILVSNSFPVPEVTPSAVIDVDDGRATRLYCYAPGLC